MAVSASLRRAVLSGTSGVPLVARAPAQRWCVPAQAPSSFRRSRACALRRPRSPRLRRAARRLPPARTTTLLNMARTSTDGEVTMRMKTYLIAYRDPERNEYEYVLRARSRRRARADAKRWVGVGRIDWNATLVSVAAYPPPEQT